MSDMFKDVKLLDWGKGTTPLYGGRKVEVVGVEGNRRWVQWHVPGEAEPTKHWVDLGDLKEMPGTPIPPREATPEETTAVQATPAEMFQALAADKEQPDKPEIAQKEIDLAKERDELLAEIESLKARLQTQTEVAEGALQQRDEALEKNKGQSRLLQEAADAMNMQHQRIASLEKSVPSMIRTGRTQRETKIITVGVGLPSTNTELGRQLDELEAEGWEIAYEEYEQGQGERCSTYFARLTREARDSVTPTQGEARAALDIPETAEAADPLDDELDEPLVIMSSHLGDDPIKLDEEEDLEPMPEMVVIDGEGVPSRTGRIIAPEITTEGLVKVGNLFLDPKRFPITCTIAQHGVEATTQALDQQIRDKALVAMQRTQAHRMPVPLLLGS